MTETPERDDLVRIVADVLREDTDMIDPVEVAEMVADAIIAAGWPRTVFDAALAARRDR